ncbi:hypothetical protein [Kibdelosporangium philippinense]|uniref:hypothetical protein n=1 Tax=Kibdelosporangium philippinense TaxID=211113 RepID=UPI00361D508D
MVHTGMCRVGLGAGRVTQEQRQIHGHELDQLIELGQHGHSHAAGIPGNSGIKRRNRWVIPRYPY